MGSYIDGTLIKGEQVIKEAKLHWKIFISIKGILTLFISPLLEMMSTEFAVTNKRVIWKKGLISRNTGEMNLKKIENIQVDQGILGRILGYGAVAVIGTGGTREAFRNIVQPLEFRKVVQEQMDAAEA